MTEINLPVQTTGFFGRKKELETLSEMLQSDDFRLITLIGTGGAGKTRLAIELASRYQEEFLDGIYFVPLYGLNSFIQFLNVIHEVLRIRINEKSDVRSQLLDYFRDKQMLLILDGYERNKESAAFISDILSDSPSIKIIVTAREALNLKEEFQFKVEGLDFPRGNLEVISEDSSAIQLFLERAQHGNPFFRSQSALACVARICQIVEGNPLAIELASGWTRSVECDDILNELRKTIDFLSSSLVNVPERHRNFRLVLEETYQLLDKSEKEAYIKLSLFPGSFTRKEAGNITGTSLPILSKLIDKSILYFQMDNRYRMHELLKQFAIEKIDLRELDIEPVKRKFVQYFAEFLKNLEMDLKGRRQKEAMHEVENELENIQKAWRWAVKQRDFSALDSMLIPLNIFSFVQSHTPVYQELVNLAIEELADPASADQHPVWGKLVVRQNFNAPNEKLHPEWVPLGLEIAEKQNDQAEIAAAYFGLGRLAYIQHNPEMASDYYQKSLAIYRALGDAFFVARQLYILGTLQLFQGDYTNRVEPLYQALEINRQIGNRHGESFCLNNLAAARFQQGDYEGALQFYLQADTIHVALDNRGGIAFNQCNLGSFELYKGNFVQAREYFEQALTIANQTNYQDAKAQALALMGILESLQNEDYSLGWDLCLKAKEITFNEELIFLANLGICLAAWGMEDHMSLQKHTCDNLNWAIKANSPAYMLFSITVAGACLHNMREDELAVQLFSLGHQHPLSFTGWQDHSMLIQRNLGDLENLLGKKRFAQNWQVGATRDLLQTAEILQKMNQPVFVDELKEKVDDQTAVRLNLDLIEPLSERETEVLECLAKGFTNKQIANELFITIGTVKTHLYNIYQKMGVKNRSQAILRLQNND
jgi:predicted ATPase/DNA-binding CsgD family transcriptional regulator